MLACCFSLSQLCMDALTSVGMLCWQSMMLHHQHHSGCRAAKLGQAIPVRIVPYTDAPLTSPHAPYQLSCTARR